MVCLIVGGDSIVLKNEWENNKAIKLGLKPHLPAHSAETEPRMAPTSFRGFNCSLCRGRSAMFSIRGGCCSACVNITPGRDQRCEQRADTEELHHYEVKVYCRGDPAIIRPGGDTFI